VRKKSILGEIESKRKRSEIRGIEGFRVHESGKELSKRGFFFHLCVKMFFLIVMFPSVYLILI